jgi:hypothetical protein
VDESGVFLCQYHSTMVLCAYITWGWTTVPLVTVVPSVSPHRYDHHHGSPRLPMFTTAHRWTLCRTNRILYTPSNPIYLKSISILPSQVDSHLQVFGLKLCKRLFPLSCTVLTADWHEQNWEIHYFEVERDV